MKNLIISLAVVAATVSLSHAQFSLKTFDGKTVSNKNKPDSNIPDAQFYFVWEADYVRIQAVMTIGKLKPVDETLLYYADTDGKMPKLEKVSGDNGRKPCYGTVVMSKKGASLPNYNWREDAYSQEMTDSAMVMFVTESEAKAFFDKLSQKCKGAKAPAKRIVLKKMMKEKK
jgi:hypothetical protein